MDRSTIQGHIQSAGRGDGDALETVLRATILPSGVGAGATAQASVLRVQEVPSAIQRTEIHSESLPIAVLDSAGHKQYGGVKIYDFPTGGIVTLGATIDGKLYVGGITGAGATGFIALSTNVADATGTTGALEADEYTIMTAAAWGAATGSSAICDAFSSATAGTDTPVRAFDGRSTATDVYLNVAVADQAAHGAGNVYFNGKIVLLWSNLGG